MRVSVQRDLLFRVFKKRLIAVELENSGEREQPSQKTFVTLQRETKGQSCSQLQSSV